MKSLCARSGVVSLLALAACTYWQRDPSALATPLPATRPLQLWSRDSVQVVHHVEVRGDSLHAALGWGQAGDSGEITVLVSAIDSVRTHHVSPAATALLVLTVLGAAAAFAIRQSLGGPGS